VAVADGTGERVAVIVAVAVEVIVAVGVMVGVVVGVVVGELVGVAVKPTSYASEAVASSEGRGAELMIAPF
jgi:hypothetical protein